MKSASIAVGNSLRWSLDVAFGKDQCRVRKDNGPQNMAALRQISHNLLKRETSLKRVSKANVSKPGGGKADSSKSCSVRARLPWPLAV